MSQVPNEVRLSIYSINPSTWYEASITTRDKQINPIAFDPKFSSHVFSKRDHDILYFPCSDI